MRAEQAEEIRQRIKECGSLEALAKRRIGKLRFRNRVKPDQIERIKEMFKNG